MDQLLKEPRNKKNSTKFYFFLLQPTKPIWHSIIFIYHATALSTILTLSTQVICVVQYKEKKPTIVMINVKSTPSPALQIK